MDKRSFAFGIFVGLLIGIMIFLIGLTDREALPIINSIQNKPSEGKYSNNKGICQYFLNNRIYVEAKCGVWNIGDKIWNNVKE